MVTIDNTEYNGDVVADVYEVLGTGFEIVEKNSCRVETGIRTQRALGQLRQGANPVGAYVETPVAETADTDYNERVLTMVKSMLYEEMNPDTWQNVWDNVASEGANYTNLAMNRELMRKIMNLYRQGTGKQFSTLFWGGNTGSGDLLDGIITLAAADANVIDITPAGAISAANVIARVTEMWEAIPDQLFENPDFAIHMNMTDWKLLQVANQTAGATTNGYLNNAINNLFLTKQIKGYASMPKNYMVGANGSTGMDSNLVFGFYAIPDAELGAPRIGRVTNSSEKHFVRVNFKLGVQYREGSEIILYKPA